MKKCDSCGKKHMKSHRRANRAARAAKPPLHWMDHPARAAHWGDGIVSAAKVKGRPTRVIVPGSEQDAGPDRHPAADKRGRVEIARPGMIQRLMRGMGIKKPS